MLEIKDLHASINGKEILKGINLTVNPGEIHALMGQNGAGKSTLSNVLVGNPAYEVTSGSVTFNGKDLLAMKPEELHACGHQCQAQVSRDGTDERGRFPEDDAREAKGRGTGQQAGQPFRQRRVQRRGEEA